MTNQQAKLCKLILKYKYLDIILKKSNISEEGQLEEILYPYILDFSDSNDSKRTIVELPNSAIIELEDRQKVALRDRITWGILICTMIISIIALFR